MLRARAAEAMHIQVLNSVAFESEFEMFEAQKAVI